MGLVLPNLTLVSVKGEKNMVNLIEPVAVAEVLASIKRRETPFNPKTVDDVLANPNGY